MEVRLQSFLQFVLAAGEWTVIRSYDRTKLPRLSEKLITKQLEDFPLATRIAMYFQHDGALLILSDT